MSKVVEFIKVFNHNYTGYKCALNNSKVLLCNHVTKYINCDNCIMYPQDVKYNSIEIAQLVADYESKTD